MAANARARFIGDYMRGKTAGLSHEQRTALFREASAAYRGGEHHESGDPPAGDGEDLSGLVKIGAIGVAAVLAWKWFTNPNAFPQQNMPGPTQGASGGY